MLRKVDVLLRKVDVLLRKVTKSRRKVDDCYAIFHQCYSVPGYDYISNLPLMHLCFLDHFFLNAPLRELIRDTFKEYLRNMKPRPDAKEEGAKELKMLYSKYSRLFSPCDPNDLEQYSKLMDWFSSPPDTLLPFLRSISALNQWSLRSVLWDYLTDPIAFLSSFAPHLHGMSMELIWDFKYLLWEYLSKPHYRSGGCLRQVCPCDANAYILPL